MNFFLRRFPIVVGRKRTQLFAFIAINALLLGSHEVAAVSAAMQEFPEIHNTERDSSETMLSAQEAAETASLPNGFRTQVFAAEPDVQNPIAATWDPQGRLWVAENFTYSDRAERFDLSLNDRVIILADTDGDGVSDSRQVFTDQVQMLTSIEVGRGGVWLLCPPKLLFIPDEDLDGTPEGPAEIVLDGFEVAKENYHNFANGLKWGPDGWLYGRCGGSCPGRIGKPGTPDEQRIAIEGGMWRYDPLTGSCEVLCHGTTNPWGHDWNQEYELFFINTVNGHLWHMIPGAHFERPFTLDPNPYTYQLIDFHADHWHFDTGQSWTDSRDGAANAYGGGHAHSGVAIYQGGAWPDRYEDKLFTVNLHGKRLNQEFLSREASGYVAQHGEDFFLSQDPFFRAVELSTGPDGQMYVFDWSDTGECHEHTGVHRTSGRIFRIDYQSDRSSTAIASHNINLNHLSDLDLVELQASSNEWWVRSSRMVLATRAEIGGLSQVAVERLYQLLDEQQTNRVRLRAMLTSYATHQANRSVLFKLLEDRDPHLRTWAVRLLTDHWRLDDCFGPTFQDRTKLQQIRTELTELLPRFIDMAKNDSSGLVRLALASTLQRMPVESRIELAVALVSDPKYADDHNLPSLVWYGMIPVADQLPNHLLQLIKASEWPGITSWTTRRLVNTYDSNPDLLNELVNWSISNEPTAEKRESIVRGLNQGFKGWRQATSPEAWPELARLGTSSDNKDVQSMTRELEVLFGDGLALEQVKSMVLDPETDIDVRRSALQALVERKPEGLKEICFELLTDARINLIAAKGLAQYDDPAIGKALTQGYRRFRGPLRPQIIGILVSRESFVPFLLEAVENKQIDASDISAFDVRQIRSLNNDELNEKVSQLWGEVRQSPEATRKRIALLRESQMSFQPSLADLQTGRALFEKNCSRCHRLYGEGESIGPDLTGANRNNLDYLLENIVDPSAVVSKDYRMSVLLLSDGRVLNGLVVSRDDKTTRVQTQNELVTVINDDIEELSVTSESPMPAGILDPLMPNEIKQLIGYLRHPKQVSLAQ